MNCIRALRLIGFCLVASLPLLPTYAQSDAPRHFYAVSTDFTIAPTEFERFKQLMGENAKTSVSDEAGCREYDVYEVTTAPYHLFIYQLFNDEAAFRQHLNSAHYKHFNEATASMTIDRTSSRGPTLVAYRKTR